MSGEGKTVRLVAASVLTTLAMTKADDAWDWWRLRDARVEADAMLTAALTDYGRSWDADCLATHAAPGLALRQRFDPGAARTADDLARHVGRLVRIEDQECTRFQRGHDAASGPWMHAECAAVVTGTLGAAVFDVTLLGEDVSWRIGSVNVVVLRSNVPPAVVPPSELASPIDGICPAGGAGT